MFQEKANENKRVGMVFFIHLQDALSQLRGVSSSGMSRSGDPLETLQSRTRELEKKVCVTVSFLLSFSLLHKVY